MSSRYGHWGTADWYHDTLYISPSVPLRYLYDVAVHEQVARILVCGMDVGQAIEFARDNPIRKPLRVKPRWWHPYLRRLAGLSR